MRHFERVHHPTQFAQIAENVCGDFISNICPEEPLAYISATGLKHPDIVPPDHAALTQEFESEVVEDGDLYGYRMRIEIRKWYSGDGEDAIAANDNQQLDLFDDLG